MLFMYFIRPFTQHFLRVVFWTLIYIVQNGRRILCGSGYIFNLYSVNQNRESGYKILRPPNSSPLLILGGK